MPDYVTIKLYADTRRILRLIAAATGEQMVQVMDRLCQEEMRELGMSVAADEAGQVEKRSFLDRIAQLQAALVEIRQVANAPGDDIRAIVDEVMGA